MVLKLMTGVEQLSVAVWAGGIAGGKALHETFRGEGITADVKTGAVLSVTVINWIQELVFDWLSVAVQVRCMV
jgi:hypothetical protein